MTNRPLSRPSRLSTTKLVDHHFNLWKDCISINFYSTPVHSMTNCAYCTSI